MSGIGIPDVLVFNQDGIELNFRSDLLQDETAIISFIFTSCQGTCPLVGANFAKIDKLLADSHRPIRLIFVTTDPETDSPARLKEWADRFGSPRTWTLLTGSRDDIDRLSIALTGSPVAGTRHHVPRAIIGNNAYGSWTHTYALDEPISLLDMADVVGESQPSPTQMEPSSSPTVSAGISPAAVGRWSSVMDWGVVAVHMTLLRNGTVLVWPRYDAVGIGIPTGPLGAQSPHVRVWNPANHTFSSAPNSYTNLFCSGHTVLPDGSVMVIGGHSKTAGGNPDRGVFDTNVAQWRKGVGVQWSRAAAMLSERWYPTVLSLPSGSALAIGGSYSGTPPTGASLNQPAEIWEPGRRGWTGFNHLIGLATNRAIQVAAVRGANGGVDVFMVGLDNRMWHSPQQPDGSFPDFAGDPIAPPSDTATSISALSGAPEIYIVRADDHTIGHGRQTTDFGWRELSGIGRPTSNDTGWYIYYPWTYVGPDGRVFVAGPTRKTFWLNLSGNGSIQPGPQSSAFRDYGTTAMYDTGKILILGGGTTATGNRASASAEFIDLNAAQPTWQPIPSMANQRKHANATVLPDGTVLVTGGTRNGGDPSANDEQTPVLAAELWNPQTGSWSTMGSAATPRLYHSTALLLPSAEVLVAGGGQGGGPDDARIHPNGVVDRPTAEIFSPPYLFAKNGNPAERPGIASVPEVLHYGRQIKVHSPDAHTISGITLVSCGSVTHAYNQNQRLSRLSFVLRGAELVVTTPANGNLCPPGYYIFFILNKDGVPSLGRIVQLIH
jgi:Galactose oxidase-like, Early set domain/SCO1/SenC/Kelch motif